MTDSSTASSADLARGTHRLDPTKSQVHYTGKHMFGMGTVHATFTIQGGELRICEPLATSSATVTVDSASFSSANTKRDKDVRSAGLLDVVTYPANTKRDKDVRSAGLLDVATYPAITFRSDSLQQSGDTLIVTGTVTAHGHTVGVDVRIDRITREGTGIRLHGRAERLDRTAFGVTGSRGMVGRYLDLELDAFATIA